MIEISICQQFTNNGSTAWQPSPIQQYLLGKTCMQVYHCSAQHSAGSLVRVPVWKEFRGSVRIAGTPGVRCRVSQRGKWSLRKLNQTAPMDSRATQPATLLKSSCLVTAAKGHSTICYNHGQLSTREKSTISKIVLPD